MGSKSTPAVRPRWAAPKKKGDVSTPRPRARRTALDRAAWIGAAREVFVAGGMSAVKIGKLATRLGVTREAFYYFFKSLQELHDELLADWEHDNTSRFEATLRAAANPETDLRSVSTLLLGEEAFRTAWDTAIRDWARVSKKVARVVARIDESRTAMLVRTFRAMGYGEPEAMARARIYYLFQVGYYTTRVADSRELREKLLPFYLKLLIGRG